MKKILALLLALICMVGLVGCNNRSLNNIIENEPSIEGIVTEVHDHYILIYIVTDGYPYGADGKVSLNVENEDSYTDISVGDEVVVYYNGDIAESDPLQINTVYAITLKTPAAKSSIDENLSAFIGSKITEHHKTEQSSENFRALDFAVLGMDNTDNETTVYMWVLSEEYSYADGLQLETGVHIPTIITVKQVNNAYELVEYWEPRDGAYYTEDIKEKFPSHLQNKVFNSQDYIDVLKAECERQALEHFNAAPALPTKIPGLTIAYGEEEITAWLGSHSWIYEDDKGEKNAIIKESNHPLYCMETMSFIPVSATTVSHAVGYEPGQVTLNFDVEPTKITVYRYDVEAADETAGEEIIMDNGYVLDLAFGNYLYHIAAEWDYPDNELGGSGDYAFYTKAPEIHNAVVSIVDTTKTSDIGYDTALEKFYENETTQYYFDGIKSEYIIVKYSNGTEKNIKEAFENGDVAISDLDKFDIDYITTPYKCKEE